MTAWLAGAEMGIEESESFGVHTAPPGWAGFTVTAGGHRKVHCVHWFGALQRSVSGSCLALVLIRVSLKVTWPSEPPGSSRSCLMSSGERLHPGRVGRRAPATLRSVSLLGGCQNAGQSASVPSQIKLLFNNNNNNNETTRFNDSSNFLKRTLCVLKVAGLILERVSQSFCWDTNINLKVGRYCVIKDFS